MTPQDEVTGRGDGDEHAAATSTHAPGMDTHAPRLHLGADGNATAPVAMDPALSFLSDLPEISELFDEIPLGASSWIDTMDNDWNLSALDLLDVDGLQGSSASDVVNESPASSIGPPTPTADTSVSQSAVVKNEVAKENAPPRRETTQMRMKKELKYLRKQVQELESELATLTEPPASSPSVSSSASTPSDSFAIIGSSPDSDEADGEQATSTNTANATGATQQDEGLWQRVAHNQLEEKRRAEVENVQLREVLQVQLRVAKSLEKILYKRHNPWPLESQNVFLRAKRSRVGTSGDASLAGVALSDRLRPRLARHLMHVDGMMEACGLATRRTEFSDAQARTDATGRLFMEMLNLRVLPFSIAHVAEVVWKCVTVSHLELDNGYYSATREGQDFCELDFAVKLKLRRRETRIHVRGMGQREARANGGMAIVWESVGETEGDLIEGRNFRLREVGYILVERLTSDETSHGSDMSTVRACVRMFPEVEKEDGSSQTQSSFKTLVDLAIHSFSENLRTMYQVVENDLMEMYMQQQQENPPRQTQSA